MPSLSGGIDPLALVLGVVGAAWGFAADRIGARWPAHEDASVRRIDWRTAIAILFGAAALAAVPVRFDDTAQRVLFCGCFAAMVLLMATDLDQKLLPDVITLPLIAVGAAALIWGGDSLVSRSPAWLAVAGAVLVPGILFALSLPFGSGALGVGDVKFLVGVGLLVGLIRIVYALFVGAIVGGVVIVALLIARRITLKSYVPFGPFLILGAVIAALLPAAS